MRSPDVTGSSLKGTGLSLRPWLLALFCPMRCDDPQLMPMNRCEIKQKGPGRVRPGASPTRLNVASDRPNAWIGVSHIVANADTRLATWMWQLRI
jgi:hypothetical protein